MEEFTNLIAQVAYNPTWNVYLCWVFIFGIILGSQYDVVSGVESLPENRREAMEKSRIPFIKNGEFTLLMKSAWFWGPPIIALSHDAFVVMINGGELMIFVYNKLFFAQFLSFTTISNLLT